MGNTERNTAVVDISGSDRLAPFAYVTILPPYRFSFPYITVDHSVFTRNHYHKHETYVTPIIPRSRIVIKYH
jgi:hypothetical protein